jgi:cysteine desulfurase
MKLVYLDWASAAPVSRAAERAFKDAFDEQGNPGSPHAFGMRAKTILEDSRREIARLVGTKPDGVIFTSGATEANNLAIAGYVQALQEAGRKLEDIHLLYLPTAHASVVETMHWLAKHGVQVESLVITNGTVDLNALKKQIRPETALVSMDAVCGQTGTLWDTRDVRRVLDASHAEGRAVTGSRILLHVDASQAPFAESIEAIHLGADLIGVSVRWSESIR